MANPENEYENYSTQTGGRLFSSAMFGFNKEEVLEYLEELADENQQQQEAAEMRIQELAGRITQLEQSLESAQQAGGAGDEALAELGTLRTQLQEATARQQELAQQLEAVKAENQQADAAGMEALRAQLAEARNEQNDIANQLEIAQAATQQAEDDLAQLREDLNNAKQESDWLREEYKGSDERIAELQRQIETLTNAQEGNATEEITALQRELDDARTELVALSAAQAELDELRSELDALKAGGDSNELRAELEDTKTRLMEANIAIDELRVIAESKGASEELEEQLTEAQDELMALRGQLQEQSRTGAQMDEQAKSEIRALQDQLREVKNQLDVLDTENASLKEQLAMGDEQAGEIENLHDHIAELVEENNELHQRLELEEQAADDAMQAKLDAANEEIASMKAQLQKAVDDTVDDELQQQIDELIQENDDLRAQVEEYKAYEEEWTEEDERRDVAERSVAVILAEANEEAARIRAEAQKEKERMQRQMKTSAGGLSESIVNLREDLAGVEGDVSGVLEAVQTALSDILGALSRTELNLNTLDVQVERFPASAPAVPKQQVVYFQSSQQAAAQGGGAPVKSMGAAANFRKLEPEVDGKKVKAFPETAVDAEQDKKLRALSETLVDTLRQMMD